MKKSLSIIIVLIIIGVGAWFITRNNNTQEGADTTATAPRVDVSTVNKVSSTLSEYSNQELGFSVKYPSVWQSELAPTGVSFIIPTKDTTATGTAPATNTINKLQVDLNVVSGACTFPQVTSVTEKSSVKVDNVVFNSISMSNASQGRQYFNRMYSTPKGSVCYMFNFAAISSSPANKGYSASQITQITANNKKLIDAADLGFKDMIKTFLFVSTPDGDNEALHSK